MSRFDGSLLHRVCTTPGGRHSPGGEGIVVPIAEWEVRGRRALVCLLFSVLFLDLPESPDSMRSPNNAKSTEVVASYGEVRSNLIAVLS